MSLSRVVFYFYCAVMIPDFSIWSGYLANGKLNETFSFPAKKKKIVLIAGGCSHGSLEHEYRAGCLLLAKLLQGSLSGQVETVVFENGWPPQKNAFENVDAIVMFTDGSGKHPVLDHLETMDSLMKKGVGLSCLHYALQVPAGKSGDYLQRWLGGYYEALWSVNPKWKPNFVSIPAHPVTSGVKPFSLNEEWYYHMRFQQNMEGITPLLSAVPPDSVLNLPGAHVSNNFVRAERESHSIWPGLRKERKAGGDLVSQPGITMLTGQTITSENWY